MSSPARYVQGSGVVHELGENVRPLGQRVLVVADGQVWGLIGESVRGSIDAAGLSSTHFEFSGKCTAVEIDRVAEAARAEGADVLVGIGGGTALDVAKSASHQLGARMASVPTLASTDAPTSALAVVYTPDGEFEEYRFFTHNPNLVLVDTRIIAGAPARFLAAGVGDALATWVEAAAVAQSHRPNMLGGHATRAGVALARLSWDVLWDHALSALAAARQHVVTPALEQVVEANTLLSGLGFESAGLAAAHAVHNGLTAAAGTHGLMHGEKVNLGTLAQYVLEGRPRSEIDEFVEFTTRVGLPNTLIEVGLEASRAELAVVAEAATAAGETVHNMPFAVSSDDVIDALLAGSALATEHRRRLGMAAPAPFGR